MVQDAAWSLSWLAPMLVLSPPVVWAGVELVQLVFWIALATFVLCLMARSTPVRRPAWVTEGWAKMRHAAKKGDTNEP